MAFVVVAAALVSSTASAPGCAAPDPATPKRQVRAEWIASVENIDWPSRPGLSAAEQQAELVGWLDEAVRRRLNTVFLQVRPTADVFWPSALEPWSQWLTGVPGRDPGYDPLAFAVTEAHRRDLDLHAWFNPYRVALHTDPSRLAAGHPARLHPDWIVAYDEKLYYNPGIPQVRRFCQEVILEAVRRYDIDGVHFDDYFYPYPVAGQQFDDEATYQRYGASEFPVKADWRRHNVDLLISELSQQIRNLRPQRQFGISPFGVWRNNVTDPDGSRTSAGVQSYDDLGADTRKWVREGWLDYIAPQLYWSMGFPAADYSELVSWWASQVDGTDVALLIGQANYKVGVSTQSSAWMDPAELSNHLSRNRSQPQVRGDVFFSAKAMRANRLSHMDILTSTHYRRPALVPIPPRSTDNTPHRPFLHTARADPAGITLHWTHTDPSATSVAVYRIQGTRAPNSCDRTDATNLLGTARVTDSPLQSFTDTTADPAHHYTYLLTLLDRTHHESAPSNPRSVSPRT
ncbi:glycoside hydrolase family 10 protein [Nocardia sp. XZ_19_385]|uniref:glycoside hydrolase family 10 protein n=1 Tax=Nocardia sp. XZ_19_385 TaxID=2769488 RepID=UPI001E5F209A|nr:family 10 glycosylhydrolase [Nocardia sp. XZ_19_385]